MGLKREEGMHQNLQIENDCSKDFFSIYDLSPYFFKLPPPFTQPQLLPPRFKPILKKVYPLPQEGGGANYVDPSFPFPMGLTK